MWGDYHAREVALYLQRIIRNEPYYTFFNRIAAPRIAEPHAEPRRLTVTTSMSEKYKPQFPRMAQLKTTADLRTYMDRNDIGLPFDETLLPPAESPFNQPISLKSGKTIGNSLCILPMEGWDGTTDGRPSEFTKSRWKKFAISGAKLLFGCEAVAVCHSGKANPNQLVLNAETYPDFVELRQSLLRDHRKHSGKPMIY